MNNDKPMTGTGNLLGMKSADKDPEGRSQPVILQKIVVRPPIMRVLDIEKWRSAMKSAKATISRRTDLYDLYEDILLDGHLSSVVDKRLMCVTNVDWEFVDESGSPVPAINDWIDTPDFELCVKEILNSKIWGYTMLEFDFYGDSWGVFNVPRKHLRPKIGIISFEQSIDTGVDVRQGSYADSILEAGEPGDLGLLLKAAPYVIYKRGNFGDWAQFIERFGQPLIDAIWDGYDESQRLLLLEALQNMGGGGQIVRPAGTQLQFLQGGTNNPTGQLNDSFKTACNEEMSVIFLGQTETTNSSPSSGYAQASVHAETETDINISDRNFVRRILNRRLVKMLQANGIDTRGGYFQIKSNKDDLAEKQARLNIDLALRNQAQLPISDDYFYETYGIEKPEDYEAQKQAMMERAAQQAPFAGGMGMGMSLRNELTRLRDEGFFGFAPEDPGA